MVKLLALTITLATGYQTSTHASAADSSKAPCNDGFHTADYDLPDTKAVADEGGTAFLPPVG